MKLQQTILVGGQDVSLDKKITNKALLEMFSNITMYHGFLAGHTSDEGVSPVSWIVMGWKMQIIERVKMFSTVHVETWVQSYNKIRATRNYAVYDNSGKLVAKAAAVWVAMDGEKGTFLRLTPELMDSFLAPEEENLFPDYQFREIRKFDMPALSEMIFKSGLQMVDYNGHVHNSEYMNLACEVLPENVYQNMPGNVEILYRLQILPGAEVQLEYSNDGEIHYVAIKKPEDHSLHALVSMS